jgi:RNase adaptor protein for sRNA GlmZ degradation
MKFEVKSFGYLHLEHPPKANLVFDVQDLAYDPNLSLELRELSGATQEIREFVLSSLGVPQVIDLLTLTMMKMSQMSVRPGLDVLSLAVGCRGGRHRSRVIVDEVGMLLSQHTDIPVEVIHLHADLPVVKVNDH